MENALVLHGTDFDKNEKQRFNNWFPWLRKELIKIGYRVWLPELPSAHHPDLNRYWNFLKKFDFNRETVLIGHSSGGTAVLGLLHKLPPKKKIKTAISVAGFYKDEGWGCTGLFPEPYDWKKIRRQADKIYIIWSPGDPYIQKHQTDFMCEKLKVEPTIFPDSGHFNLETDKKFHRLPKLLDILKKN